MFKEAIKKQQIKRISNSIHRRKEFDMLDEMELQQLYKAYRNMPKESFKNYLMGFLDGFRVIEKTFVAVPEEYNDDD